ncbi:hypothetical protein SMD20_09035 [Nonomuraea sp. LP-02]|uniref:hypothetical protein n=1 Tax=Nonomuraea sp. LP-02 TaxID=3097960 RepID=UPI002E2FC20E|nr:hypothetical protein [Nonomuraea sp. LP-02]MED7924374.1 hypothetical protein [Nonomuraea sp. LP-02]
MHFDWTEHPESHSHTPDGRCQCFANPNGNSTVACLVHATGNATDAGLVHLSLDGIIIATDRCAEKIIDVRGHLP